MAAPVTIAEGSLATTPFAHVLVSAQRKKLTGTLAVWPDDDRKGQDRILFDSGQIVSGRLLEPAETLERGILSLFLRERAPFAVYEGDLVGDGPGVAHETLAMWPLLAAGLRGGGRDDVVSAVLGAFDDQPVRVARSFDSTAFGLTPKELACIDELRASAMSIPAFIASSPEAKAARRVAYLLAITSSLEREAPVRTTHAPTPSPAAPVPPSDDELPSLSIPPPEPAPARRSSRPPPPQSAFPPDPRPAFQRADRRKAKSFSAPPPPPAPAGGLAEAANARWLEIADRVVRADEQTYFEILGVSETDGAATARSAYFELVKKIHPDRLPPELDSIRPFAERLFQLATEARETLEEDEKRMAYLRNVRNGGGTPASDRKLMGALAAAHELEKATVLTNMGKWSEVLDHLEDAKIFDPSQLDIYALEAWALFNLIGKHPPATTDRILELTEFVLVNPAGETHERARYTRALTLKKVGKESDAIELLRKIVERNPRHLEAAREIRLFEMRARDAGKAAPEKGSKLPEGAGFLSKLFGKKE